MTRTPAPALTAVLDGLDELRAKATADGKWRVLDIDNRPGPHSREILDDEGSVAVCSGDNDGTGNTLGADRAALIVSAVNAVPKLTAALRAVLALADFADGTGRVVFGISDGGAVWVRDIRAAITTALEAS